MVLSIKIFPNLCLPEKYFKFIFYFQMKRKRRATMKNYNQVYVKNSFEAAKIYCKAFEVLSDGGVILEPIHEFPWSSCCATVIDKFGVRWWISI